MSTYLIGDIHGCYEELKIALNVVKFNKKKDKIWITGDLVARGNQSLEVLRFIKNLGNSARIVLGNHDLNLIAIYFGIKKNHDKYKLSSILEAHDSKELIDWLRIQPILQIDEEKKLLMIHAGIFPTWNIEETKNNAKEVEEILRKKNFYFYLNSIYNNKNDINLKNSKISRFKFLINVFTRIRYCLSNKELELNCKIRPDKVNDSIKPWFTFHKQIFKRYNVIFGHWSTLEGWKTPKHVYGIDTGCCWGKYLTLFFWEKKKFIHIPSTIEI